MSVITKRPGVPWALTGPEIAVCASLALSAGSNRSKGQHEHRPVVLILNFNPASRALSVFDLIQDKVLGDLASASCGFGAVPKLFPRYIRDRMVRTHSTKIKSQHSSDALKMHF